MIIVPLADYIAETDELRSTIAKLGNTDPPSLYWLRGVLAIRDEKISAAITNGPES